LDTLDTHGTLGTLATRCGENVRKMIGLEPLWSSKTKKNQDSRRLTEHIG